jgi:hypothetical protein
MYLGARRPQGRSALNQAQARERLVGAVRQLDPAELLASDGSEVYVAGAMNDTAVYDAETFEVDCVIGMVAVDPIEHVLWRPRCGDRAGRRPRSSGLMRHQRQPPAFRLEPRRAGRFISSGAPH